MIIGSSGRGSHCRWSSPGKKRWNRRRNSRRSRRRNRRRVVGVEIGVGVGVVLRSKEHVGLGRRVRAARAACARRTKKNECTIGSGGRRKGQQQQLC